MEIKLKKDFVSGTYNTVTGMLKCVDNDKHGKVILGIADDDTSWIIPIATIKLYSSDLYKDFKDTEADAVALGKEICRRFNEFPTDLKK